MVMMLNENGWKRNTQPLNLIEGDSEYPYLYIPNKFNQTSTSFSNYSRKNFKCWYLATGGSEYRVNDKLGI